MNCLRALFALIMIAVCASPAWSNGCFDEKNLVHAMHQAGRARPALLYVWSPRMVYSVQNMAQAATAAANAGMDFIALHDNRVPPAELLALSTGQPSAAHLSAAPLSAAEAATSGASPLLHSSLALCAQQLIDRDALRHFPTAFVIAARGLHPHPIVGAMPLTAWQQSIALRLTP
jgi:hypothetical protein